MATLAERKDALTRENDKLVGDFNALQQVIQKANKEQASIKERVTQNNGALREFQQIAPELFEKKKEEQLSRKERRVLKRQEKKDAKQAKKNAMNEDTAAPAPQEEKPVEAVEPQPDKVEEPEEAQPEKAEEDAPSEDAAPEEKQA